MKKLKTKIIGIMMMLPLLLIFACFLCLVIPHVVIQLFSLPAAAYGFGVVGCAICYLIFWLFQRGVEKILDE